MSESRVLMEHPKLPGRQIRVRKAGVKARERAGWKLVDSKKARTESEAR